MSESIESQIKTEVARNVFGYGYRYVKPEDIMVPDVKVVRFEYREETKLQVLLTVATQHNGTYHFRLKLAGVM